MKRIFDTPKSFLRHNELHNDAERLAQPTCDISERIIARSLWSVLHGNVLSYRDLVVALRIGGEVTEKVEELAKRGYLGVDRFGRRIYGAVGITLVPTMHRVHLWRPDVFASSLPLASRVFVQLGESGFVHTRCPSCEKKIRIHFKDGHPLALRPRYHNSQCTVAAMTGGRNTEDDVEEGLVATLLRWQQ